MRRPNFARPAFVQAVAPLALVALFTVAGCSRAPQSGQGTQTLDVREDAPGRQPQAAPADAAARGRAGGPPNVSPTAAPGVAFTYAYAFRLGADRIAEVQEQHARACEELGIQRCRITGMSFRQVDEDVEASLEFGLAPELARRFGRAGQEVVQAAEGSLIESRIDGEDVGTAIQQNTRSIDQMRQDLARLEQQIADANVQENDKIGLRTRAEELRQQIRNVENVRQDQQQTLATTPVTFRYGSDNYASNRPDFVKAIRQMWEALLWGLYGLMVFLAVLAPWILLGVLIWLVVRFFIRRSRRREAAVVDLDKPEPMPAPEPVI